MENDIIKVLSNKDKPNLSIIEINDILGYTTIEQYQKLDKKLKELTAQGILYYSEKKKKYLLLKNSHLLKGKFLMNRKGFGFVEIGDGKEDIYINKNNLGEARHNDIVLIELIGDKTEGKVIKILSRDNSKVVGTIYFKDNICYVHPDSKEYMDMEITKETRKGLVEGHKVIVSPINGKKYIGNVIKIIGHKNDVGIDIVSFVYAHNFKPSFPDEVMEYLECIPDTVEENELSGRLDLRDEIIFTIDGDDTKDIDDAISIKKNEDGNYELGVHIADVSHYVKEGTVLDEEAYERATSVYLVDRVIPMLPHKLSNGICSLNPNVDRLALSCIMTIDKTGKIKKYDIQKSVIRSRIQMTYKKVNAILDNNEIAEGYEPFVEKLQLMKELSDILRAKMVGRGYIEFSSPEAKILVDENCHPIEIKLREEGTGEKIIENFMVAANETVGSFVFYQNLPGIYRVHDKPNEERLTSFFEFLSARGYVVTGKRNNITSKDLQKVLKQLKDKPDYHILNDMAIRSQAKAVYSNENIGHFGLGSACYSHFTSPIRRYPDLILHRLVKDYTENYSEKVITKWEEKLPLMAEHCSVKEQDADKCERDVDDMKKAEYMEDHIGETFEGVISGVHEFGIFVELDNTVEGLIKIENMPAGGYNYNQKAMSLISKNKNKQYRFGDRVVVKVINASKETSMIDFELVERKLNLDEEGIK